LDNLLLPLNSVIATYGKWEVDFSIIVGTFTLQKVGNSYRDDWIKTVVYWTGQSSRGPQNVRSSLRWNFSLFNIVCRLPRAHILFLSDQRNRLQILRIEGQPNSIRWLWFGITWNLFHLQKYLKYRTISSHFSRHKWCMIL